MQGIYLVLEYSLKLTSQKNTQTDSQSAIKALQIPENKLHIQGYTVY